MSCIAYNDGYKYQLKQDYSQKIPIQPIKDVGNDFINLTSAGILTIKKGYAWDGPSGPTIDTPDFIRGSLVHDALYQLMREEELDKSLHRDPADRLLQRICIEDGMGEFRAWVVYQGVHRFGNPSADPANKRPETWAPSKC